MGRDATRLVPTNWRIRCFARLPSIDRRLAHLCCGARFRRRLSPRPSLGLIIGAGWGPAVGVGFGGAQADTERLPAAALVETRRGMRLRTVNVCAYRSNVLHQTSRPHAADFFSFLPWSRAPASLTIACAGHM
jgi:hypothetical protein